MVDYTKWDNIVDSDSENEESESISVSVGGSSSSKQDMNDTLATADALRVEANVIFEKAISASSDGGVDERILISAVEKYEAALEIAREERATPGVETGYLFPCHLNCATAAVKLGRYDMGLKHSNAAVEIQSDHSRALYIRGYCHREVGNLTAAKKDFDLALKIATKNGELSENSDLVSDHKDLTSLIEDEAKQVRKDIKKAMSAVGKKDFPKASEKLETALSMQAFRLLEVAEQLTAAKLAGTCHLATRQAQKAMQALSLAQQLASSMSLERHLVEIMSIQGNAFFKMRQPDKAADIFRQALDVLKNLSAKTQSMENKESQIKDTGEPIFVLDAEGNMIPEAKEATNKVESNDVDNLLEATLFCNLGLCLVQLRQLPDAILQLSNVESLQTFLESTGSGRVLLLKALEGAGDALAYQGDFDLAKQKIIKAQELSNAWGHKLTEASSLLFLAELDFTSGNTEQACAKWKEALDLYKEAGSESSKTMALRSNTHFKLGEVYKAKHNEESKQWLQQASDEYTKSGELISEVRKKMSKSELKTSHSVLIREIEAWFWAGSLAASIEGRDAEDALRKSLVAQDMLPHTVKESKDLQKRRAETLHYLAMAVAKQERYSLAEEYVNEARSIYYMLEDRNAVRDLHKASAIMCRKTGNLEAAKASLQSALDLCVGPSQDETREEDELRSMMADLTLRENHRNKTDVSVSQASMQDASKDLQTEDGWSSCMLS